MAWLTPRKVAVISLLSLLGVSTLIFTTRIGATIVEGLAQRALAWSGSGRLELSLQRPLAEGLRGGSGSYVSSSGQSLARWEQLSIDWPSLRDGGLWLSKVQLQDLTIQIPPGDTSTQSSEDWLTQLTDFVSQDWLSDTWSLHVEQLAAHKLQILEGQDRLAYADLVKLSAATEPSHATLALQAQGFKFGDLEVSALRSEFAWSPGTLRLVRADLQSSLASLEIDDLHLDATAQRWSLRHLQAELAKGLYGQAKLEAQAPQGALRGTLSYSGHGFLTQSTLQGQIANLREATLLAQTTCTSCGPLNAPWNAEIKLSGNAVTQHLQASADLGAHQTKLKLILDHHPQDPVRAKLSWNSQNLGSISSELRGQSKGQARCDVQLSDPRAQCELEIELQGLYPSTGANAKLRVQASKDEGLVAQIDTLSLTAKGQRLESTQGQGTLKLHPDGGVQVSGISLETPDRGSWLQLSGHASSQGELDAKMEAKHWELATLSALVPGLDLSGQLDLALDLERKHRKLQLEAKGDMHRVRWRGQHWGRLQLRATQDASAIHLKAQLRGAEARARLRARLDATLSGNQSLREASRRSLDARLDVQRLSSRALGALHPDLGGELAGHIALSGTLAVPKAKAALGWNHARYRGFRANHAKLQAQLSRDSLLAQVDLVQVPSSTLSLDLKLGIRRGAKPQAIVWDRGQPLELGAKLSRISLAPVAKALGLESLGGQLDAEARLFGVAQDPSIQGWLSASNLHYGPYSVRDLTLSLRHLQHRSKLQVWALRGRGHLQAQASIPIHLDLRGPEFAWRPHLPHQIDLELKSLDSAALAGILELPQGLELKGQLHAKGSRARYRAHGLFNLDREGARWEDHHLEANFSLSQRLQHLRLNWRHDKTKLAQASAKVHADLVDLIRSDAIRRQASTEIKLRTTPLDLRLASPWLPDALFGPGGTLVARATAKGPLGHLQWDGDARLSRGTLSIVPIQQRVEKIEGRVTLRGETMQIQGVSAKVGRGWLRASGALKLAASPKGRVNIELHKAPLRIPGAPFLEVSSKIDASLHRRAKVVEIDAKLQSAKLDVLELLTSDVQAIPKNPNVHFSDAPVMPVASTDSLAPAIKLRAKIVDTLRLQGPMISTRWSGDLTLEPHRSRAKGELVARPGGSVDLLGNHFQLRRARLEFVPDQGMIPMLDLRALTQVDSDEITVIAQGPANRPQIDLQSSSGATRNQIIATLLTGTAAEDSDGQKTLAHAATALLAESGPGLTRAAQRLGVNNLRLSFGNSLSDAIVSAGTWVNSKVYLESKIRTQAPEGKSRVEGHIRYGFRKNWVLEGYVGDRNAGGGGIWWQRPPRQMGFRRRGKTSAQTN